MSDEILRAARLSADGVYRWWLSRWWDMSLPGDLWVMLNPSTADAEQDDPTIRRCIRFSQSWGSGGLVVVNLFALRSTVPGAIYAHPDPVGPENDATIFDEARAAFGRIVCAWGVHGAYRNRGLRVVRLLQQAGRPVYRLGAATKHGHPRHPLYVKGDTPLIEVAA